jgi:hypothetical protein
MPRGATPTVQASDENTKARIGITRRMDLGETEHAIRNTLQLPQGSVIVNVEPLPSSD